MPTAGMIIAAGTQKCLIFAAIAKPQVSHIYVTASRPARTRATA